MTTYYLNDPSSNWDTKTNTIQGLYNTNLTISASNSGKLYLIKNDSSIPEKYTEVKIGDSYLYLTTYINASNLYCSMEEVNNFIYFKTSIITNYAMAIGTTSVDFLKPLCSLGPSTNTQLVNKLYVDDPIQQASGVKGGTSLISNIPKYYAYDFPTMYVPFGYQQIGFLYPTENIIVTGLYSFSGSGLSNGSVNQMWLLSFPSLTSNIATIIAKCSNTNFWKSAFTNYASAFTEAPFSITLEKGRKYGICIYSNSSTTFTLKGIDNNLSFFTYPSTNDLQMGGSYAGTSNLSIGTSFNVDFGFAFQIPYVVAYG